MKLLYLLFKVTLFILLSYSYIIIDVSRISLEIINNLMTFLANTLPQAIRKPIFTKILHYTIKQLNTYDNNNIYYLV